MIGQIVAFPRGYLPSSCWSPGLHLVIERITILAYVKTPTRGLFTFLLDQAMHVLSMALVVWLSAALGHGERRHDRDGVRCHDDVVQLAMFAALLTVTLFGAILVFETGNAVAGHRGCKGLLLALGPAASGWPARAGRRPGRGPRRATRRRAARGCRARAAPAVRPAARARRPIGGAGRKRGYAEAAAGIAVCVAAWLHGRGRGDALGADRRRGCARGRAPPIF